MKPLFGIVVCWVGACGSLLAQSSYDLRAVVVGAGQESWVPGIQDQGIFGDCWTFASATAMESNLLQSGVLPNSGTPPPIKVSSWHLSTANGAPESLVGPNYGGSGYADWGGFEYQALGYATRGQGSWAIPGVTANSTTNISIMGGGPVLNSSNAHNPFPEVLVNNSPAHIGHLVPPANQPQAFLARSITMWDQGYGNNVALPAPINPGGYTYDFTLGALDPQVQAVKAAILANGAMTTSMNSDYSYFNYIPNGNGTYTVQYYNPGKDPSNTDHEVTIIGWDDSYEITNGNATSTGAWIVQNSWGKNYWTSNTTAYENDGTFYAAYNDPSIGRTGVATFEMEPMGAYAPDVLQNELGPLSYSYYYDDGDNPMGMSALQQTKVAGLLTTPGETTLLALGLASQMADVDVTVKIYRDWNLGSGDPFRTETFTLEGIGYELNDLSAPINLLSGETIVIELIYDTLGAVPVVLGGTGLNGYTTVTSGLSYYHDGSGWVDMAGLHFASNTSGVPDIDGGVLFLKGVVAIPEPGTFVLIFLGAGLLVGRSALRGRSTTARLFSRTRH